jgi:hypothetical protein
MLFFLVDVLIGSLKTLNSRMVWLQVEIYTGNKHRKPINDLIAYTQAQSARKPLHQALIQDASYNFYESKLQILVVHPTEA